MFAGPGLARITPELAFLERHGHDPALLARISHEAQGIGMPADLVAIASGHIAEEIFYRALAAEIGAPFVETLAAERALLRYSETLEAGVMAVSDRARPFALAPRGAAIARLIAAGPGLASRVSITTPTALAACARRALAGPIAEAAAWNLPRRSPELSAQTGWAAGHSAIAASAVALISFFGHLAPLSTLVVAGLSMLPFFLMLVMVRMAATLEPEASDTVPAPLSDRALPVYTVLVPLYQERRILPRLVDALAALDYPPAKLDVKLLVEADDPDTRDVLAGLPLPPFCTILIVPPGEPRTKPRALNVGLMEARGTLVTVFDAEDVPEPDQLRLAAALFHRAPARLGCVQAHLAIDNTGDGLLTRLFALEYAALFDVVNPGLARIGVPFLLGGTSNHFRVATLRGLGGWDAWNVTEDADLAIRMARKGYVLADCPSTTWEEAPPTLAIWMKQRRRWMKGFLQTIITHSRDPLGAAAALGFWSFLVAVSLTLGTVLSALGFPLFVVATALALHSGALMSPANGVEMLASVLALTLFGVGLLAITGPPVLGAWRRGKRHLLRALPALPIYLLLVSIATWWSLVDLARAPSFWHKTEHGLSRSSDRTGRRPGRRRTRAT